MNHSNMNTEKKDLTVGYSFIVTLYWIGFAAIGAFASAFLLHAGLTNSEIGVVLAVGCILAAVLQPILSTIADRPDSPSIKTFLMILGGILAAVGIFILFSGRAAVATGGRAIRLLTAGFYAIAMMLLMLLQPFMNALSMESLNQGHKLNFGASKAVSSLGYASASYGLGYLITVIGHDVVPLCITIGYLLFLTALLFFPFKKTVREEHEVVKSSGGAAAFFRKYPRFAVLLLGCMCIYLGHTVVNSYILQIIEPIGGGSAEMGTSAAIAALSELPTLFFFSYLVKKVRCDVWLRMSGVFFTLKLLFSLLATSVMGYYFVQIFQMGGWALLTVSIVYYVNAKMDRADVVKGQGYASMSYTIGNILGSLLGGRLLDAAGVRTLLAVTTVISAVGAVIMIFSAEKTEKVAGQQ